MSLTVSRVLLNPKVFNNGTTTKKYRKFNIPENQPDLKDPILIDINNTVDIEQELKLFDEKTAELVDILKDKEQEFEDKQQSLEI